MACKQSYLIIGGNSQDARILRKLLLTKKTNLVHVISRNSDKLVKLDNEELFEFGSLDFQSVTHILKSNNYDYIFLFSAQSSVFKSFNEPELTFHINTSFPLHVFQTCLEQEYSGKIIMPLSSECFGNASTPCNSGTEFRPQSPYATSKAVTRDLALKFRENGLRIDLPILFNHESIYRASFSVIFKLINFVRQLSDGISSHLEVGNFEIVRDWSHAAEVTELLYNLSKEQQSVDVCIGSGNSHSLNEVVHFIEKIKKCSIAERLRPSTEFFRVNDVMSSYCDTTELNSLNLAVPKLYGTKLIKKLLDEYDAV